MQNQQIITTAISQELAWLSAFIKERLEQHFSVQEYTSAYPPLPQLNHESPYHELISQYKLNEQQRLILGLALAAEVAPHLLDVFRIQNTNINTTFSEIGFPLSSSLPTLQLAAFLCNTQSSSVFLLPEAARADDTLFAQGILYLAEPVKNSTEMLRGFGLSKRWLNRLTGAPMFNTANDVPGIQWNAVSELEADNLLMNANIYENMALLNQRMSHQTLRVLFHGARGIGKRQAALLMAKRQGKHAVLIDGAMLAALSAEACRKLLSPIVAQARYESMVLIIHHAHFLCDSSASTDAAQRNLFVFNLADVQVVYCVDEPVALPAMLNELMHERIFFYQLDQPLRAWEAIFRKGMPLHTEVELLVFSEEQELTPGMVYLVWQKATLIAELRGLREIDNTAIKDALYEIFRANPMAKSV